MQEFNTLINQKTALCMHSCLNGRLVNNWTIKNMNPDVTPYRMWLDVSVFPIKMINKAIFIILALSNWVCTQYDGICQNTNITCDGNYTEGMCSGGADTQCCLSGGRKCYTVFISILPTWCVQNNRQTSAEPDALEEERISNDLLNSSSNIFI